MFFQVFAIVFLVNQLNIQVVAQEAVYECKAVTDPHVYTWRQKGSAQQPNQYQDCYMPSFVTLVRNEYLYYRVKVIKRWMVEAELWFYDIFTKKRVCVLYSEDFQMEADSDNKCAQYGITWKATNAGTHYTMTVASNQTNFLSTIQFDGKSRQYTPHFNIHVWQPAHLALKSTGICTQFDQECQLKALPVDSELDDESIHPQARTITRSQAESICGVHVSTYLGKSRRAPHQRNANMNDTILNALTGCIEDLMFTGQPKAAESMVSVLMIEELTSDMTSIDSIQQVINTSIQEATAVLDEAIKEAQAEVPQLLGLSTTTAATTPLPTTTPRSTTTPLLTTTPRSTTAPLSTTTTSESTVTTTTPMTTTVIPLASFKCSIYQDIYVQTWHPTNQATPPTRSCSGQSANFELVKNKYIRFTIRTTGSVIEELTLVLFGGISSSALCTVTVLGQEADWMECEQNGINPSLIKTFTHETLTVHYEQANFTAIVIRDIGVNVGRYIINVYQAPELVHQSTGICNTLSSCTASKHVQSTKNFIEKIF